MVVLRPRLGVRKGASTCLYFLEIGCVPLHTYNGPQIGVLWTQAFLMQIVHYYGMQIR